MSSFRTLTTAEIEQLEKQGCRAARWETIGVADGVEIANIRRVGFGAGQQPKHPFAQGLEVETLDETGSIVVAIHDKLSWQEALEAIGGRPSKSPCAGGLKETPYSILIEKDVVLEDVRLIEDAWFHEGAEAIGATRIQNCSIYGGIGDNVILSDTIVLDHSHVGDGAQMDHCFVGQGSHIGRMYSATQSLFFCNCHFENGEACAYVAGPYSVSHHKATLMIACITSFFNAGSGSNQSNHSYKMGPNKWGVLGRGSKMGSSSYLYWPARTGEFSTVIGHHFTHFDLTDLPFSLIAEREGVTHVIPGQNLGSCGTRRDVEKWPKRDKRGESKLDNIDFRLWQEGTVEAVKRGLNLLKEMQAAGRTDYQGCIIAKHQITKGIRMYELALRLAEGDKEAEAEWAAMLDADAERDLEAAKLKL